MCSPPRIFVRFPNWVGDVVMARSAIDALQRRYPEATFVGMAPAALTALVDRLGRFGPVLQAPRGGAFPTRVSRVWAAAGAIRRWRPELAVIMAPSFEAAFTTWLAGVPRRVGHATDRRTRLLTHPVALRDDLHRTEAFGALAQAAGAAAPGPPPPLVLREADRVSVRRLFAVMGWDAATRPVFLNPAAAKPARAWSDARYRGVAERLSRDRPVVIHARPPFAASDGWARRHGIALVDDVTLPELAAILERSALYVGNDSGPAHLAAAVGVRTVTIFGSSIPTRTGPRGMTPHRTVSAAFPCAPCRERFFTECPTPPTADGRPPCLDAVTTDAVMAAVDAALAAPATD